VREEDWAALRNAVPGFAAHLDAAGGPGDARSRLVELAAYIDLCLENGDDAPLLAAADAFESVYAGAEGELQALLSVGLLEDVIHACEDHRYDIAAVFHRLGPAGRDAWAGAWRYTHGGREWPALDSPRSHPPRSAARRKR
jgi:hypothetical protein